MSDLKNISQFPGKRNKMGFFFFEREREPKATHKKKILHEGKSSDIRLLSVKYKNLFVCPHLLATKLSSLGQSCAFIVVPLKTKRLKWKKFEF